MQHMPRRASLRAWERHTSVSARALAREHRAGRLPAEQIGRALVAERDDVLRILRELLERVLSEAPRS
jgi:hypothetical protein